MSLVKFACICDKCDARGPEYTMFPHCRECGDQVCPACDIEGERDEETGKTLCKSCAPEEFSCPIHGRLGGINYCPRC